MKCFSADIISTGTPAGLAPLRASDSATIEVGRIGELTNPVALPVATGRR
jgi:2-keto-4-pentenoate hydratase/2-oxohepta-3-ene-1,7-dioic acid hydratase in catechol pathway